MADVNAPPGAHDIYEEEELHAALTKLVAANTHVKRWIFKVRRRTLRTACVRQQRLTPPLRPSRVRPQIDDEFGGRGHAFLDVGGLKVVQTLRRQRESMSDEKWNDPEVQALAAEQVSQALHRNLARRVTIVYPSLYPSWPAYMKAFTRLGA